jgi:catechol 2,3-dioxygenase-like lactoylglutathione lyase family enzyme
MPEILTELAVHSVPVEAGPVERTGAQGRLLSVYVRDPDGNLIELSNPR